MSNIARKPTKTGGRAATEGVIPGKYALSVGMPDIPAPDGWEWTPLSDVTCLESGHTPSRKHPEYWDGDVCWIGIKDATDNHGRTILDTYQHTNALGITNSSARILPKDTVCLSRTASVGYVVVMGKPMATSQDFINWVCSEQIDHRFLKYVLVAEREALLRFASGTTHQTIYFPEAKAFHVCLPEIEEQRAIADCLQTIDDKIVLLEETNTTLEAIAQALFKSWFLDFDPVRAKAEGLEPVGVPPEAVDLFPDELVESESGMIPKGWNAKPIYDLAKYINGAAYKAFAPNADKIGLPVIKIAELKAGITNQTAHSALPMPQKYKIGTGDILFSWSGNPDTSIDTFIWHHGEGWLNQHIFKVVGFGVNERSFVLQTLKNLRPVFAEIARNKQTTGLGHVTVADMKRLLVAYPPKDIMAAFAGYIAPIHDKIFNNSLQAISLASLRNTLLPRLMSGKLRISEVEKELEAV